MRCCLLLVAIVGLAACSRQPPAPAPAAGRGADRAPSESPGTIVPGEFRSGDAVVKLPKQVGGWVRPDAPKRVTAEGIFDYMDGGGELYLAYRFSHLDVFEYKTSDDRLGTILVELYAMTSELDAFGLLSTDWTGEPVPLASNANPGAAFAVPSVPPHHALFGAGLLRMCSGRLYSRILASRDTPGTRDAVLRVGRALAGDRVGGPPAFLASVPPTTAGPSRPGEAQATGARVRPDRTCFFRSHLVLNSQYFLASGDILNLGPEVAALTTEYVPARPGARPLRLILVRYPSRASAVQGLEMFRKAYLPKAVSDGKGSRRGAAETEHGWVTWALEGQGLAIALDAEDAAAARRLVSQAAHLPDPDIRLH